ncbi:hypothetical protein KCP69_26940 (plasmid) [Salmonella enterica subsp. enterica]|nr:hypothetical protein KCP69_26940 [Salmonella enterica subsp. enterica]
MVCALEAKFLMIFSRRDFHELELGGIISRAVFYSIPCVPDGAPADTREFRTPSGGKELVTVEPTPIEICGGNADCLCGCLLEADINRLLCSAVASILILWRLIWLFIQLSLLGIAAEVVTGNTLTNTADLTGCGIRRCMLLPAATLKTSVSDLNRHRVMLAFMRGLSDAT